MHRSDPVLEATVSDELLYTPSVDSHPRVSVVAGVVTLKGDVASVPERLAATAAAERVWGVQRVIDQLVVRSAGASGSDDAGLTQVANSMLDWSVDVPANAIKAEVKDRKLTLTGVTTWDFQRAAAARAVRSLRGITGVDNRVALRESPLVSVVKDGVEAAIRRTMPLEARAITVDVQGHRLTLHGSVRSLTDRRRVEHLAWAAAGVTTVDNQIVMAP